MGNWISTLRADPTDWLLGDDNPSVRYLALTGILGKPPGNAAVTAAQRNIMRSGIVPQILSRQEPDGHWATPDAFYTAKYTGTVWQTIILAEHFADGTDERVHRACEFLLDRCQDRQSGGFSPYPSKREGGGRHGDVIPCLTGNMVWSMLRLGYGSDSRVQNGITWITKFQRFDDGDGEAPVGWPYERYEMCWGKHACHMGVVKSLKALAEIPAAKRTKEVNRTLREGADYLLKHHVHKRSHDVTQVSKPGWKRFGFPLMYQTDILEILEILTRLGYRDARMDEAIGVVLAKQGADGRWNLAATHPGRFGVDLGTKGQPSKWVTLNALRVLKRYYGNG